ncbi:hypothetical protein SAMN04515671_1601 [Nakamurella panacisegetis]|uniref:DUF35 domain-containing protein n=1 Tax=Nakamurella panacisegetis TaxID=1090615 RepID=A0A1H0LBR5_9ACTN|nr:OB-fold domain-containing protein [Nakamurella panacisegetis]SDO65486.1 hypothetical protein SAMN04515671_1601 [Nakamurella panacisegetis]
MHNDALPPISSRSAPHVEFRTYLDRGELAFQRCGRCASVAFPPRLRCRNCSADALQWEVSTGIGAVYSVSVLTPRGGPPYCVALVDLDEGFRVMTNVNGAPAADVAIGDPVRFAPTMTDQGPLATFAVTR